MKRIIQTAAFILALSLALPALAMGLEEAKQQLETAKQQGLLGETPAGYLEVVRAEGNAREVADAINNARREEYTRIAEKHNIPVTQVETVDGDDRRLRDRSEDQLPDGLQLHHRADRPERLLR